MTALLFSQILAAQAAATVSYMPDQTQGKAEILSAYRRTPVTSVYWPSSVRRPLATVAWEPGAFMTSSISVYSDGTVMGAIGNGFATYLFLGDRKLTNTEFLLYFGSLPSSSPLETLQHSLVVTLETNAGEEIRVYDRRDSPRALKDFIRSIKPIRTDILSRYPAVRDSYPWSVGYDSSWVGRSGLARLLPEPIDLRPPVTQNHWANYASVT